MRQWIIIIIMILVGIPLVSGAMCEEVLTPGQECTMMTPSIECVTFDYQIWNETSMVDFGTLTTVSASDGLYSVNINLTSGDYLIHLCDNATRHILVKGKDEMASLAIVFFVVMICGGLIVLPFIKKEFLNIRSPKDYSRMMTNILIRRGIWSIAIYLMMLNSAIVSTIAQSAGLDLTDEMFRYMWLFGLAGWLSILVLGFSTITNLVVLYRLSVQEKKFGGDDFE